MDNDGLAKRCEEHGSGQKVDFWYTTGLDNMININQYRDISHLEHPEWNTLK